MPAPGSAIGSFGNFVTSRLATGAALTGPPDLDALSAAGITHVIDCRTEFDDGSLLAQRFHYLYDPTEDDGQPKPPGWFQPGIAFALQAISLPSTRGYAPSPAEVTRRSPRCEAR